MPRWPLSGVSLGFRAASQGFGVEYFVIDCFLGDSFRGYLSFPVWCTVLQCGARLQIHTLNYWAEQSVVPVFLAAAIGVCSSVTLHIVDLWL